MSVKPRVVVGHRFIRDGAVGVAGARQDRVGPVDAPFRLILEHLTAQIGLPGTLLTGGADTAGDLRGFPCPLDGLPVAMQQIFRFPEFHSNASPATVMFPWDEAPPSQGNAVPSVRFRTGTGQGSRRLVCSLTTA